MKKEMNPSTVLVPCPVVLLSVHGEDKPNIITLSWAANVCSKPPSVVVGIRSERHSYEMVVKTGDFVLNIPTTELFEAVEFAGTKSGRDYNKFTECGLTPIPSSRVKSPMIKECPVNIECTTREIVKAGVHDVFLAEVQAVHMDESVLDEKGRLDPTKASLFTYLPTSGHYWTLGNRIE